MELEFDLIEVPSRGVGYRLGAFTIGVLRIVQGGQILLRWDDALLVEFAIALARWNAMGRNGSFSFTTMDEEEGPTIEWPFSAGQAASLTSIYDHRAGAPIAPAELGKAAQRFIERLDEALRAQGLEELWISLASNVPGLAETLGSDLPITSNGHTLPEGEQSSRTSTHPTSTK